MVGRSQIRKYLKRWFRRFKGWFSSLLSLLSANNRKIKRNTQEIERIMREGDKLTISDKFEVAISLLSLGGVVALLYPYIEEVASVKIESGVEELPTVENQQEETITPEAKQSFIRGLTNISEGGYANVKEDKGGETYRGIARNSNPNWKGWEIIDKYKAEHGGIAHGEYINDTQLDVYVEQFWKDYYAGSQVDRIDDLLLASHYWRLYTGAPATARNLVRKAIKQVIPDFEKTGGDWNFSEEELAILNGEHKKEIAQAVIEVRKQKYYDIVARDESQRKFLAGWLCGVETANVAVENYLNNNITPKVEVIKSERVTRAFPEKHKWGGKHVGFMYELLEVLNNAGIGFRVTSGYRPKSKTASNRTSYHALGKAVDIVPDGNETFESIARKIVTNPTVLNYFKEHKLGVYDETTKQVLSRTGGTGPHYHIGPDKVAIRGLEEFERLYKEDILLQESEPQSEFPLFWGGFSYSGWKSDTEVGTGNQQIPYR